MTSLFTVKNLSKSYGTRAKLEDRLELRARHDRRIAHGIADEVLDAAGRVSVCHDDGGVGSWQ